MKRLLYFLLIILGSCSSTKVVYDYDSKTNFKEYKMFNFFDDVGKGLNELDVKRIKNELTDELSKKGMRISETPDIFINFISKERESLHRNTIGIGIGGGGNVGFGVSGGIPIGGKKINQEIIVDFVESKNNQLIWNGTSNSTKKEKITPEEKLAYYKKIIQKILEKYPPKK